MAHPRKQELADWIALGKTGKAGLFSLPHYVQLGREDMGRAAAEAVREAQAGRSRPYSARRAPASIALMIMALEAWLNDALTKVWFAAEHSPEQEKDIEQTLFVAAIDTKGRKIPLYYGGQELSQAAHHDLPSLVSLRHELFHSLPATNVAGEIDRLRALEKKALLLRTGHPKTTYMIYERIESYDLAWWAWETAARLIEAVISASDPEHFPSVFPDYHYFDSPVKDGLPTPAEIEASVA
jgi:hypothetical protein